MDNRVTKRRLSDFLAYEWILVAVVLIATVFILEFLYGWFAVKPTVGQSFKILYDENVVSRDAADFESSLGISYGENGKTFSYDVLKVDSESLVSNFNVLYARMSVQDGDIIITDFKDDTASSEAGNGSSDGAAGGVQTEKETSVRVKSIVDNYEVYCFDDLYSDGADYLAGFLKDDVKTGTVESDRALALIYGNLDQAKIDAHFLSRMKGDNRFRTAEQKESGKALERARIERLCIEVTDFKRVLDCGQDIFYTYTRYEQVYNNNRIRDGADLDYYKEAYEKELADGRENARYGLKVENLSGGEISASKYFRTYGEESSKNVVICAFDFSAWQPDLQFETISFINGVIRSCSDILAE